MRQKEKTQIMFVKNKREVIPTDHRGIKKMRTILCKKFQEHR